MKIRNFTPHAINCVLPSGKVVTFPSEGSARVSQEMSVISSFEIEGEEFNITSSIFGEVYGLPQEEENTIVVVSRMVMSAAPDRKDLVCPGAPVRDDAGVTIGCKNFDR